MLTDTPGMKEKKSVLARSALKSGSVEGEPPLAPVPCRNWKRTSVTPIALKVNQKWRQITRSFVPTRGKNVHTRMRRKRE